MDLRQKVEQLKQAAQALGFEGFGIAAPDTRDAIGDYDAWLQAGHAGTMQYLERGRDKRADMNQVLPGVKSVLCLSTPYRTVQRDLDYLKDAATGDISCYALNLDYHDIIEPRLKQLEDHIGTLFSGCRTRRYVDTGPVMEKAMAQQAGLGWIGKHTNLLTAGTGSWYFLSEILLDVELPLSTPAEDQCGPCRACLDICPTQAIIAPYVLDARRCISYLTIELKGVIPLEFRRAMENRIYGCDDCQIVCPWNDDSEVTPEPAFAERAGTKSLIDLMQLDAAGFAERFRKSPIKRIKRRGLLRNVAIALGNSGDPEAIPVLKQALRDEEPLIRAHAVWALGELLGETAYATIGPLLNGETESMVLDEVDRLKTD